MGLSTTRGRGVAAADDRGPFRGPLYLRVHPNDSSLPIPYFGEGMNTATSDRVDVANQESRSRAGLGMRLGDLDGSVNVLFRGRRGAVPAQAWLERSLRDYALNPVLELDWREHGSPCGTNWYARAEYIYMKGTWTMDKEAPTLRQAAGDLRGYWNPGKVTLAGRLLFEKTLTGEPDYLFRKAIGGDDVLRGHSMNRFRGKNLGAAQAELRWQAWSRVALVGFVDTASVSEGALKAFRTTPGVGARFGLGKTGRVKLRVDYGVGKDEKNVTVTFGECF